MTRPGDLAIGGTFPLAGSVTRVIGMRLGYRIRRVLSEDRFGKVFSVAVMLLGIFIIMKSVILFR